MFGICSQNELTVDILFFIKIFIVIHIASQHGTENACGYYKKYKITQPLYKTGTF